MALCARSSVTVFVRSIVATQPKNTGASVGCEVVGSLVGTSDGAKVGMLVTGEAVGIAVVGLMVGSVVVGRFVG
jgi:hypothetical protein